MSAEIGSGFGYKVSVAYLIIMRKNLLNMIKKYQYPLEKYTKLVYIIFELENTTKKVYIHSSVQFERIYL